MNKLDKILLAIEIAIIVIGMIVFSTIVHNLNNKTTRIERESLQRDSTQLTHAITINDEIINIDSTMRFILKFDAMQKLMYDEKLSKIDSNLRYNNMMLYENGESIFILFKLHWNEQDSSTLEKSLQKYRDGLNLGD